MNSTRKHNITKAFETLVRNPSLVFKQPKGLFLLSHMRARTSAISHVLGSHENIIGHGELHRVYNNRFDFLKTSFLLAPEKQHSFFHDKLLHNHLSLSSETLTNPNNLFLFTLRPPKDSAQSYVRLYKKTLYEESPKTDIEIQDYFKSYYISRLNKLCELAETVGKAGCYFESDDFLLRTDDILQQIGEWIGLDTALTKDFQIFPETGTNAHGDRVGGLFEGTVKKISHSDTIEPHPEAYDEMDEHYKHSKRILCSALSTISIH